VGDILLLTTSNVVTLGLVTLILLIVTVIFWKEFVYVSVDMEGSIAHGMNARAYHYLMLVTAALAITLATKAVGAILVYAILVAPAAASNEVLKSVRLVVLSVFVIALTTELLGIAASFVIRVSPSAVAGVLAALTYIIALGVKKQREMVEHEMPPELVKEDIPLTVEDTLTPHDH
jgi:ABC-type Mn2+/Zn2+ transport system permease subunit